MAAGQSFELESKLRRLEQNAKTRFGGTTDSELSELEDVVARTAARVQSAESEVPISLNYLPGHFAHLSYLRNVPSQLYLPVLPYPS